jgi:hypothetical protein
MADTEVSSLGVSLLRGLVCCYLDLRLTMIHCAGSQKLSMPKSFADHELQEAPTFDPTLMKKKKSRKSVAFAGEDDNGAVANGGDETPAEGRLSSFRSLVCLLFVASTYILKRAGVRLSSRVGDKTRQ